MRGAEAYPCLFHHRPKLLERAPFEKYGNDFAKLQALDAGLVFVIPKSEDQISRYRLVWIDKASLCLAAVVLVGFVLVWLMLILAAGTAPTGRLSTICLGWTTKVLAEGVVPIWLIARGLYATVPKVVQSFESFEMALGFDLRMIVHDDVQQ